MKLSGYYYNYNYLDVTLALIFFFFFWFVTRRLIIVIKKITQSIKIDPRTNDFFNSIQSSNQSIDFHLYVDKSPPLSNSDLPLSDLNDSPPSDLNDSPKFVE